MKKLVALACLSLACAPRNEQPPAPPESVEIAQTTLDATVKIELPHGGHGSGFFIDDDTIVTAAHVVDELWTTPVVRTRSGGTCEVVRGEILMGYDAAILWTVGCDEVTHLAMGPNPQEGAEAWAAGAPLDAEWSITKGVVTDADHELSQIGSMLVLDLVAHPGMSGGPVVDYRGRVIGITVRIMTPEGYSWGGKTFAVPLEDIREQLRANGLEGGR